MEGGWPAIPWTGRHPGPGPTAVGRSTRPPGSADGGREARAESTVSRIRGGRGVILGRDGPTGNPLGGGAGNWMGSGPVDEVGGNRVGVGGESRPPLGSRARHLSLGGVGDEMEFRGGHGGDKPNLPIRGVFGGDPAGKG